MTDDLATAFSHPSERAKATAEGAPLDRISMTEHLRQVEIGAFQAERGVRQTVRFDVVVEVDTRAEQAEDDVDRILSYDTIVEAIDAALGAERINLLETLAARIADGILEHPHAARVFVRVGKLDRGPYTLGVEIVRSPAPGRRRLRLLAGQAPRPAVVFLSNAARARADLGALLDALQAEGAPLILCVDRPEVEIPRAGHPMPQRRIDLLAVEQGAWCLAARDPRCVVVETRTELDWAMRHGQISVWAPSKLVLDAVHGPEAGMTAPFALARWLAEAFDARLLLQIGEARDPMPPAATPAVPRVGIAADATPVPGWLSAST